MTLGRVPRLQGEVGRIVHCPLSVEGGLGQGHPDIRGLFV